MAEYHQVVSRTNNHNKSMTQMREVTRILLFKMDHPLSNKDGEFEERCGNLQAIVMVAREFFHRYFTDRIAITPVDYDALKELTEFFYEVKKAIARWNMVTGEVTDKSMVKKSYEIVASMIRTTDMFEEDVYWSELKKSIVEAIIQKLSRLTSSSADNLVARLVETIVLVSLSRTEFIIKNMEVHSPTKIMKQGEAVAHLRLALSTLNAFKQPFLEYKSATGLRNKVNEITSTIHNTNQSKLKNVSVHEAGYLYLLHLIRARLLQVSLQ
ncbi:hypothetical protein FGIG_12600 [Fasciola gigantica]|uniref:Uncharacterized protein n=1 Tax=Fasciola gigantica TaxID=46835 RepID=A0A504YQ01_FASGI|nr:hypothetical protein FGIG_12600 [Fasciola gigantica]